MMEVYSAISAVSKALAHEGISKDRSNQQQGYKFRGIDDCLNALASLLPTHDLVIIPSVLEREVVERQTKSGGSLFYTTVKVQFAFISTKDGSRHDAVVFGEAMDSADKSTNKAMSAAYKYAVLLTFCIPTEGDNDADAVTHEVATEQAIDLKAVQEKLHAAKLQVAYVKEPVVSVGAAELADMQEAELKSIQDQLNAARQAGKPKSDVPQPLADEFQQPFLWTIKGKHQGKSILDIDSDYLGWYEQNGKIRSHVDAAKIELDRREAMTRQEDGLNNGTSPVSAGDSVRVPASQDAPASIFERSGAMAEHETILREAKTVPKLQAAWDAIVQDKWLEQTQRAQLYQLYQRQAKGMR